MNDAISTFLDTYLSSSPQGESPQALLARAKHWLTIAQSPAELYPNANEYELRCRSRQARQNARRLLQKHPELIPMLEREVQ
jgi:hypothetical protein